MKISSGSSEISFVGGNPDHGFFFHHEPRNLFGSLTIKRTKFANSTEQLRGYLWLWLVSQVSEVDPLDENWISSRTIAPIMLVSLSSEQDFPEVELQTHKRNFGKMVDLYEDSSRGLPVQSIRQIPEGTRIEHWRFFKQQTDELDPRWIQHIGVNRKTTIDYLNLQRLGCINYVKHIADQDQEGERAIRARVAYARRQGWIKEAGHGIRTSQLTKLINEKNNQQRT